MQGYASLYPQGLVLTSSKHADICKIVQKFECTKHGQGPRKARIRHPKTDRRKTVLDQGQAGTYYGHRKKNLFNILR